MLTAKRLREVLAYEASTGVFTWRNKTGSKGAGSVAGTPHKEYLRIQVDDRRYRAHRLAWLYMTGAMPSQEVDHKNGDGTDNRWDNLRDVSHFTNMQNQQTAHKNSKTGVLGCHKQEGKYRARILINGVSKSLGMYDTAELAQEAYLAAKREQHAEAAS